MAMRSVSLMTQYKRNYFYGLLNPTGSFKSLFIYVESCEAKALVKSHVNLLTRDEHRGEGLRSFQEVHIGPLEGFTVVGLQVAEHKI